MWQRITNARRSCWYICGLVWVRVKASPLAHCVVFFGLIALVSLIVFINYCLVRLLTFPGAVILNVGIFWLLLKLAVRIIVFPGSVLLWKRNTEAAYRVEMSKQFHLHLEHLHMFLVEAVRRTGCSQDVTMEGVMLGCKVVESLSRNFRIQQRDQVRFTAEQLHLKLLVQGVEAWLADARVRERGSTSDKDVQVPLLDWLQKASRSIVPIPASYALAGMEIAQEAGPCIERVEELLAIFANLQESQNNNCCVNARRFLRAPTVGSLHQLRAELISRYGGRHYWVRTPSGRKIDGMLILSDCPEADIEHGSPSASPGASEDIPLKTSEGNEAGATIVWCNPNAGYYETMVYESHWLDFYLDQGCNVFLFNYSGFGRSTGNPTPDAMAADGDAVVEFLKRRGVTRIGVHGRSIGGIVACHLAGNHPEHVQLLVADRTFSSLEQVGRFTFGKWAVNALSLSGTCADNFEKFMKARCYKVLICDPKDMTIPDIASLRTVVAVEALNRFQPHDRLLMADEQLQRVADSWSFLQTVLAVSDRSELSSAAPSSRRTIRQPVLGNPASTSDAELGNLMSEDSQGNSTVHVGSEMCESPINKQWLEEHASAVRSALALHRERFREALEIVGSQLNASGMTLQELFSKTYEDPGHRLRCFLANLQVWGSLGSLREAMERCVGIDPDIEIMLRHTNRENPAVQAVMARTGRFLTPDKLARYHRRLARLLVAQVRRDFRRQLEPLRCALEQALERPAFTNALLGHLREVEDFISSIHRFFEGVDGVGSSSAPTDTGEGRHAASAPSSKSPRPVLDRSTTGYLVTVECGHNGVLVQGELTHVALHLRASGFCQPQTAEAANDAGSSREQHGLSEAAATGSTAPRFLGRPDSGETLGPLMAG
eukprot:gnl/TRDRNA2_/TRDRNA2_93082_c0_seq1.p1 gnl/TRDRNA2_/TRDRNA2_93082_c0~~gnl/TRDRNA2_/TRDRNA2_93082_c0_seq1.p1  ORF type:complete len:888 (+),score=146.17 gnl/TRDRNA2_/TRDRNA2_93082_c0_seq1:138-2801(+)